MNTFFSRFPSSFRVILCGLISVTAFVTSGSTQDNVRVNTTLSVDRFMQQFVNDVKANESIKAWRIQIITTDDRREMEAAKSTFSAMYPGMNLEWKHVAPYYQVRVGYFENKNKLMPFLLELKKTFPSATPVYDHVSKRALVSN